MATYTKKASVHCPTLKIRLLTLSRICTEGLRLLTSKIRTGDSENSPTKESSSTNCPAPIFAFIFGSTKLPKGTEENEAILFGRSPTIPTPDERAAIGCDAAVEQPASGWAPEVEGPAIGCAAAVEGPAIGCAAAVEGPAIGCAAAVEGPAIGCVAAIEGPAIGCAAAVEGPAIGCAAAVEGPAIGCAAAVEGPAIGCAAAVEGPAIRCAAAVEGPAIRCAVPVAGPVIGCAEVDAMTCTKLCIAAISRRISAICAGMSSLCVPSPSDETASSCRM